MCEVSLNWVPNENYVKKVGSMFWEKIGAVVQCVPQSLYDEDLILNASVWRDGHSQYY